MVDLEVRPMASGGEKRRGKRERAGRPPIGAATRALVIRLYEEREMTCKEIADACQISERSLYRVVREGRKEDSGAT